MRRPNAAADVSGRDLSSATGPPRPDSPAVIGTLETVLAPGRRARLSPYVESAQLRVRFGEAPDPARRHADVVRILAAHQEKVKGLARSFIGFCTRGKRFTSAAHQRDFLECYLAYYLPLNVCKVQIGLLELARQGHLAGDLSLVDVGLGAGTTLLAAVDFFLARAYVCDLHGAALPVASLRILCIAAQPSCGASTARRLPLPRPRLQ